MNTNSFCINNKAYIDNDINNGISKTFSYFIFVVVILFSYLKY